MAIQIATPYSDLFRDKSMRDLLLCLSDVVELRKPEQMGLISFPSIFHCELNLVALWSDGDRSTLSDMALSRNLEMISFHMSSRYGRNILREDVFHGMGRPYSVEEMEARAQTNVAFLRKTFGDEFPILVENNNDLETDAYQNITDGDFIARIVEYNNILFLWDISHSEITAINRSIDHEDYIVTLPIERCVQVHLSGYGMRNGVAYDEHNLLTEKNWAYFRQKLCGLHNLKFATIEYYKDGFILQNQLRKLRLILEDC